MVHSSGQGIAGYFDKEAVSEAVDPLDPAGVATAIQTLANRLPAIHRVCVKQAKRFDWKRIAKTYADLYEEA